MVELFNNAELNDVCFEIEALEEWNKLTQELGLENQLKFTEGSKSPVPFPYINQSMLRIFETLCPEKVDITAYNKTPIPLDILKQFKYCRDEEFFSKYEIWYDDKSPDPLLIGIISEWYGYIKIEGSNVEIKNENNLTMNFASKEDCQSWCLANGKQFATAHERNWGDTYKRYLIARWADVIRPLSELKQLAKERLMEKYGADIKNTIEDCKQALTKLNENTLLYLNGEISEGKLKGTSQW